jgi:serine/threonine-protein kinase PknG
MLAGRLVVAGEQFGHPAVPDQPPSPADPLGKVVEFSGGLGHIAEIEQRPHLHQRQLDGLRQIDVVGIHCAVAECAQRIQRLHRLRQHGRL